MQRRVLNLAFALCIGALSVGACTPPKHGAPVVKSQRDALGRVGGAFLEDAAMQRVMLGALLALARERLLARIEDETVLRYVGASGDARIDALRADVDAGTRTYMARDVIDGALSFDLAAALVTEHAALLADGASAESRRAPLRTLSAVTGHDVAAGALLDALDERAGAVAALLADLGASTEALGALVDAPDEPTSIALGASAALWRRAVLDRIDDPERRAAGERLLGHALGVVELLTGSDHNDETEDAQ